ncbi:MAG TPA: amidase [bacterium]|nr:amidase [bacterium]
MPKDRQKLNHLTGTVTRDSFRKAVGTLRRYTPGSAEQRPAFEYRLSDRRNREWQRDAAVRGPRPTSEAGPSTRLARDFGTILGLQGAIRTGRVRAEAAVSAVLENIRTYNHIYNAFAFVNKDAIEQARAIDRRTGRGQSGPTDVALEGIPSSIKDIIHAAGMPTTASSAVPTGFPTTNDAAAVAEIRRAGAIIVGKTHTHEFALGVTQPQSRNPWDPDRVPGGSSGGAAIALITGMCLGALGTDTRASIRVPAALCGTVGYKPTYGLLPTDGIVPLSWSMDHCAVMARTVEDAALVADIAARETGTVDLLGSARTAVRGLRIGIPETALVGADVEVADAVSGAARVLSAAGVTLRDLKEPSDTDFDTANAMGLVLSRCEAAAYHRDWLVRYPAAYTKDVYEQLDEAARVSAVDYLQAQRYRGEFAERMARLFVQVDALLMPTTLIPAPRRDQAEQHLVSLSRNCVPWSFIGFPAISVPGGMTGGGLPIGLQVVGAPCGDGTVLALAAAIEGSARLDELYDRVPEPWRLSLCSPRWAAS